MEDSNSIYCRIVSREISGLFCKINGADGDCQNCGWDGVLQKRLLAPDPPLGNFLTPWLIRRLSQAEVVNLEQIMALGEEGLSGRFGPIIVRRIKKSLAEKYIDLPELKSDNVDSLLKKKPLPPLETLLTDLLPSRHLKSLKRWNITTLGNLLKLWTDLNRLVGNTVKSRIKRYLETRYEIQLN